VPGGQRCCRQLIDTASSCVCLCPSAACCLPTSVLQMTGLTGINLSAAQLLRNFRHLPPLLLPPLPRLRLHLHLEALPDLPAAAALLWLLLFLLLLPLLLQCELQHRQREVGEAPLGARHVLCMQRMLVQPSIKNMMVCWMLIWHIACPYKSSASIGCIDGQFTTSCSCAPAGSSIESAVANQA